MLKYVDTMVTFSNSYPESKNPKSRNYIAPATED